MSSCADVQRYLDAPASVPGFPEHLSSCEACTAKVEAWRRFGEQFREATSPLLAAPTQGEVRRLMSKAERPKRRAAWPYLLAASAAAAALVLGFALRPPAELPATVDGVALTDPHVESADGERQLEVSAAKIRLARNTSVRLTRRTAKSVRVELDRGAVSLAVEHRAADQDFTVAAGGWEAHVVGTRFSVQRAGEAVEVRVTEGQVRVTAADGRGFDVRAGQTFRAEETRAEVLEPTPPAPEPKPEEPTLPDEPAPAPPSVSDAKELQRWRTSASSGQCAKVMSEVKKRLDKTPGWAAAWKVLADCQRLTNAPDDAIGSYAKVVALSKRDEADRARLLLADLLQQRSEHARAEKLLREYLAHKPPADLEASARVRLARSLLALGRTQQARDELTFVTKKLSGTSAALQALELLKTLP